MANDATKAMTVRKGQCIVLYACDIGVSVDLDRAGPLAEAGGRGTTVRLDRRMPKYFDFSPEPLCIVRDTTPLRIGAFETLPGVEMLLYDFGAVSVSFSIPIRGPLGELTALTCELAGNTALVAEARRQVELLMDSIRAAIVKPGTPDLFEDYVILHVAEFESATPPAELVGESAHDVARVLRAERDPLSPQEVADAMAHKLSYGRDDLTVVDWNAALVVDRELDDVRAVLEFANVELLELRFLDRRLDRSLDRAYEIVARAEAKGSGSLKSDLRRLVEMQLDGAVLFERFSNAPKLLGDQYLARVYRLATQRFHVAEWNSGILRKLDTMEGLYEKMAERASSYRMEILEWIIILLIAFEIVMSFIWRMG